MLTRKEKRHLKKKERKKRIRKEIRKEKEDKSNDFNETNEIEDNFSEDYRLWLEREEEWKKKEKSDPVDENLKKLVFERDASAFRKAKPIVEQFKPGRLTMESNIEQHSSVEDIPRMLKSDSYCALFLKTGSCRFGSRCNRNHKVPFDASTLLVQKGFSFALTDQDQHTVTSIEMQNKIIDYIEATLPQFRFFGKILSVVLSGNSCSHLKGNLYLKYESPDSAIKASLAMNGRNMLCCRVPVNDWSLAICNRSLRNCCPNGNECHYIHPLPLPPISVLRDVQLPGFESKPNHSTAITTHTPETVLNFVLSAIAARSQKVDQEKRLQESSTHSGESSHKRHKK